MFTIEKRNKNSNCNSKTKLAPKYIAKQENIACENEADKMSFQLHQNLLFWEGLLFNNSVSLVIF